MEWALVPFCPVEGQETGVRSLGFAQQVHLSRHQDFAAPSAQATLLTRVWRRKPGHEAQGIEIGV